MIRLIKKSHVARLKMQMLPILKSMSRQLVSCHLACLYLILVAASHVLWILLGQDFTLLQKSQSWFLFALNFPSFASELFSLRELPNTNWRAMYSDKYTYVSLSFWFLVDMSDKVSPSWGSETEGIIPTGGHSTLTRNGYGLKEPQRGSNDPFWWLRNSNFVLNRKEVNWKLR